MQSENSGNQNTSFKTQQFANLFLIELWGGGS